MTSKSTVGSSSAGIQRSLSNRFNLTNAIPSRKNKGSGRRVISSANNKPRQHLKRNQESTDERKENIEKILSRTIRLQQESTEWKEKEAVSLTRSQSQTCAICYEFYRKDNEQQVILSCCHVYHPHCLNSFERFVGFENRFCPLCRAGCYSKKLTKVGSLSRQENAIIIMQKVVRGHFARQEFRTRLRSYYDDQSNGTDDEILNRIRQRFYAKELENLGKKLLREIDCNDDSVDKLGSKIDQSLGMSRALVRMFDERQMTASSNINWDVVMKAAFERRSSNDQLCPICMSTMERRKKSATLLSCSHMFCTSCIQSFESFNSHRTEIDSCPVCRSTYAKLQVMM